MSAYILSCDWGTSSFRLRLVELTTVTVKGELTSQQGIARMFTDYQQAITDKIIIPQERIDFYLQYIFTQIQLLARQLAQPLTEIPVIISGMASSSIGMTELTYAGLPFSLDGTSAVTQQMPANNKFPHDVLLISGVRSENDVMRGEETQLIGLAANPFMQQEEVCIFPGTHSKHLHISNYQMKSFKTYMTGELFQTIASHTILQNSIEKPTEENFEKYTDVFSKGVSTALNHSNLLHTLFTVRTEELFKKLNRVENYYYLSGIIIGYELAALKEQADRHITLCCASNLLYFYESAISTLDLSARTGILSSQIIDTIVVKGQIRLYKNIA